MLDVSKIKSAVVLAPHTDDGEIGCGASIAWLVEQGVSVHYVAFSSARQSLAERGLPDNLLIDEVEKATAVLGVIRSNLHIFDYPVRRFPEFRQQILQDMIDLRSQISPSLVFCPSLEDIHQDHQTVAHEALRAFKKTTLLSYEMPWNNMSFQSVGFLKLDKKFFEAKSRALKEYKSQSGRNYLNEQAVMSLAKTRGIQIEAEYAECFEVQRWVVDAV